MRVFTTLSLSSSLFKFPTADSFIRRFLRLVHIIKFNRSSLSEFDYSPFWEMRRSGYETSLRI